MKTKLACFLIAISLLLSFASVPGHASAAAVIEIEVTAYDALVFEGDRASIAVTLSNVGDNAAYDVVLVARNLTPDPDTYEQKVVGTLDPGDEEQVTLSLPTEDYAVGTNQVEVYATFFSGFTGSLFDVWGSSASNVFAVGDGGTILRYNGSTWSSMSSGFTGGLHGVWGSATNDVFAVGNGGTILHYNGSSWSSMDSGTSENLLAVWGQSSSDVFAVGNSGTILHYDGNWTSMTSNTTDILYGVWGSSASDVIAVGYGGTIVHYNGTTWSADTSGTTSNLYGIWGTGASDVFAVGAAGTIRHYDGSWGAMTSGSTEKLYSVWGTSSSNVFAAGSDGTILYYDSNWSTMASGSTRNLHGVWANSSSSDVFAVGDGGTILHYDGSSWSAMNSSTSGESAHWTLQFEVRETVDSITLRVVESPPWIYSGTVFTAQLEIQNLRQEGVSGARIKNGTDVLYEVGALDANETLAIELRVADYVTGENSLALVAQHEYGSAPVVTLEFDVLAAESAVKVYLASVNSPLYVAETLELSLVVAASENAEISDLEIRALTTGIQPAGYYLGGTAAEEEQQAEIDVGSLLYPTSTSEEDEEAQRVVVGKMLNFEASSLEVGTQSLSFQVAYRLGSALVEEEFSLSVVVSEPSSVKLIEAEPTVAVGKEDAIVILHVANNLPITIDGVSVVPVGDFEVSPSEFFIGEMSPQDFLPANFTVPTSGLSDGDTLSFKIVYRVGRTTYETAALATVLNIQAAPRQIRVIYIAGPVVVVALAAFFWRRKRKRWI